MSLGKFRPRLRTLRLVTIAITIILIQTVGLADPPRTEVSKTLPASLGDFRQTAPVRIYDRKAPPELGRAGDRGQVDLGQVYGASTEYTSATGEKLIVSLYGFANDAAAYSHFTLLRNAGGRGPAKTNTSQPVGVSSFELDGSLTFFKGIAVVAITSDDGKSASDEAVLGNLIAAKIDLNEPDVPVLVKHLPNWETVEAQAIYAVRSKDLERAVPDQPILKEVDFDGGTEAVTAKYGQSQLVIVEFTTPQFSVDNDSRIWTRLAELKAQGQPVPSAYRRVGNYSVFVFNAADEKSANALIDQVKYEQVVQWLGDDPHLYERLQRYFTQTSAGVLVAVLKSSGLSLVFCLAAGAIIGTMLFRRRRAQRAQAFSDAGGAVRLNLDELTGTTDTRPLLTSQNPSRSDSTSA